MSKQQNVFPYKHKDSLRISKKYRSGNNLIYDCTDKHFACVSENDGKNCQERYRKEKLLNQISFSCRLLKLYKENDDCEKMHQGIILKQSFNTIQKLCNNPFGR